MPCSCAKVDASDVSELKVIGGSHYPLGYEANPPSLDRLEGEALRRFVAEAIGAAQKLRAHFAATGEQRAVEACDAEIARLSGV